MKFTKEINAQIEAAVEKHALEMVGRAADQEVMEQAKKISRAVIIEEIEKEVKRQIEERAALVEEYNAFCQREMSEPDFKAVQEYAAHEYFDGQTAATQAAIKDAYCRIESNKATAADTELVKRYFTEAKEAWKAM